MQISISTPYKSPLSKVKDVQDKNTRSYKIGDYINDKLTFTRMMNERLFKFYNQKGQVSYGEKIEQDENPVDIDKRESIRKEIWKQTYSLLQEATAKLQVNVENVQTYDKNGHSNDKAEDPFGVAAYYSEHPEDLKKVQLGIVPDYFKVKNTGDRILKIWFPENGGPKEKDAIERAENNIGKAYSEVGTMFGNKLPQIVLDTREYVLGKVKEMK